LRPFFRFFELLSGGIGLLKKLKKELKKLEKPRFSGFSGFSKSLRDCIGILKKGEKASKR